MSNYTLTESSPDVVNYALANDLTPSEALTMFNQSKQSQALTSNPNVPVQGAVGDSMVASNDFNIGNDFGPRVDSLELTTNANLPNTTYTTNTGGLGNYGTYNGVGVDKAAFNSMQGTDHGGTLTQNPQSSGTSNGLGYLNAAIGLGGLGANVYYAEQNKRAQEDARDYARSRDALADSKISKFQSNLA